MTAAYEDPGEDITAPDAPLSPETVARLAEQGIEFPAWQPQAPMVYLRTDSSLPDEHFVRETAITFLALDALAAHDSHRAENAVAWARGFLDRNGDAEHDGDCTGQPMTCSRCVADEAMREAREIHDD